MINYNAERKAKKWTAQNEMDRRRIWCRIIEIENEPN